MALDRRIRRKWWLYWRYWNKKINSYKYSRRNLWMLCSTNGLAWRQRYTTFNVSWSSRPLERRRAMNLWSDPSWLQQTLRSCWGRRAWPTKRLQLPCTAIWTWSWCSVRRVSWWSLMILMTGMHTVQRSKVRRPAACAYVQKPLTNTTYTIGTQHPSIWMVYKSIHPSSPPLRFER